MKSGSNTSLMVAGVFVSYRCPEPILLDWDVFLTPLELAQTVRLSQNSPWEAFKHHRFPTLNSLVQGAEHSNGISGAINGKAKSTNHLIAEAFCLKRNPLFTYMF